MDEWQAFWNFKCAAAPAECDPRQIDGGRSSISAEQLRSESVSL